MEWIVLRHGRAAVKVKQFFSADYPSSFPKKGRGTMKPSIIISTLFIGLAITVLSAPIPQEVPDLAKGLGFCTLVTILSFGTVALSYCIKGAINNHNNHRAIDHYFEELRKWEAEKLMMGHPGNRSEMKIDRDHDKSESDSEKSGYDSDATVVHKLRF